jgi:diphthine synthase
MYFFKSILLIINPVSLKMLYLVGLGLHDEKDITLKGVEAAKNADIAYIEFYTSPWRGSLKELEKTIGKKIGKLQRSDLEEHSKKLIEEAKKKDVAVLVPGDPLVATTHSSLITEARKEKIKVAIIHSSSIFSAIAETGLQIYKFGKTATIAYPEKNFFPKAPYDVLAENQKIGAHTLFLLDVKAVENRYMTVTEAIDLLLQLEEKEAKGVFTKETQCVGVARLGGDTMIKSGAAKELMKINFGPPPHVLIVPGKLHFAEEEYLKSL